MFIGKWNKSVILTYIGLIFGALTIVMSAQQKFSAAMICLILAGICDLFDGQVARKCKRSKDERRFGIQLDSLADIVSFGVAPIAVYISVGFTNWYHIVIFCLYIICQVARLAHFNSITNEDTKVKYYEGLPVTFSALIFPLVFIISYFVDASVSGILLPATMTLIAFLNILNIKIPKPRGIAYGIFSLLAILSIFVYSVILR